MGMIYVFARSRKINFLFNRQLIMLLAKRIIVIQFSNSGT